MIPDDAFINDRDNQIWITRLDIPGFKHVHVGIGCTRQSGYGLSAIIDGVQEIVVGVVGRFLNTVIGFCILNKGKFRERSYCFIDRLIRL